MRNMRRLKSGVRRVRNKLMLPIYAVFYTGETIKKEECINHVAKRWLGGRLRKIMKLPVQPGNEDVEAVGYLINNRGRLNDAYSDRLTGYY